MNSLRLIIRSFVYYWRKNLGVGLGIALSTAILTGALVVGDSMQYSLQRAVDLRLGPITHTITAGDRYFTPELAARLAQQIEYPVAPILQLESSVVVGGGQERLPKVQVFGVDASADAFFGFDAKYGDLAQDEVIISENLAQRLNLSIGDMVLFRIRKASLIPLNAPFVSDEETSMALRLQVKSIAGDEEMGRLNLLNNQTAPFNCFIALSRLDELMELNGKVNTLLIAAENVQVEEIKKQLQQAWVIEDLSLNVREIPGSGQMEISSERVFLDSVLSQSLLALPWSGEPILTYFVNTIRHQNRATPYSFISSLPDGVCGENEIIIGSWLADDLGVQIGDEIQLEYFQVGPLRRLVEEEKSFTIRDIMTMEGRFGDPSLAPNLPGLSDAGNCRDWETGVPIDLESIRDRDEDYWDEWKGTPKAFISINQASQLWSNRFGNLTAFRFDTRYLNHTELLKEIRGVFEITDLGFQVNAVRNNGKIAAQNGVNFGELFLGLSFFVLAAAILLSVLLYRLSLAARMSQIGTMRSLGLSQGQIRWIVLSELGLVALVGAILGLGLTIIYNQLIFAGLNSIWNDIVRTDLIALKLNSGTLILGLVGSILIGILSLFFIIHRLLKNQLVDLSRSRLYQRSPNTLRLEGWIGGVLLIIVLLLLGFQIVFADVLNPTLFFVSGGCLLLGLLLVFDVFLHRKDKQHHIGMGIWDLALKNAIRNRGRTYAIVLLLALGTFLIVTVGANRKNHLAVEMDRSSGTGGFMFFTELTVPFLEDLNDEAVQAAYSIEKTGDIAQFRALAGDDASCLNLNAISQPRILGANPQELTGRFSFATQSDLLDTDSKWLSLDQELGNNIIPGIADQTVIQWSLLKEVGDTLWYTDQQGEEFGILLIGGLASSVFQGNLIISEKHFLRHFPSSSGSKVMLIEGENQNETEIQTLFASGLRDYGIDLQHTRIRLAEFSSIENTYLSIFLLLGALGLIIGTLGLGVIVSRTILDRKQEIALQRAIGIPKRLILRQIVSEFGFLMIVGILLGSVSALLAVLPGMISPGAEVNTGSLLLLIGIIVANGFLWIIAFAGFSLKMKNLNQVLRND